MDRRDFLLGLAGSGVAGSVAAGAGIGALAFGAGAASAAHHEAGATALASEKALAELRDTLAAVEASFAEPAWRLMGPADAAEARGFLMHMLQHALEAWLEADPARPVFKRFVTPEKKLLGDNPDAVYFTTAVSPEHAYRIRGNAAGATYTSFTVELGTAEGSNSTGIGATLNDTEFDIAADGSFEISVGGPKQARNWLALPEGSGSISSRHYYEREQCIAADRLHNIPLMIENQRDPGPPAAPDDASIAAGILRVARFVKRNVTPPAAPGNNPDWVSVVPNQLPPPKRDESNKAVGFAAVDNVYSMAPFLLKPDEALVIRGRFPKCRFANVVVWNRFLQTFDYTRRHTSLNRKQVKLESDGSFKVVIAHRDPGVPNWIETEDRMLGSIFWRFLLPEGPIEPLTTRVVALDAVKAPWSLGA